MEGVVRMYRLDADGNEIIQFFFWENQFVTSLESYTTGRPFQGNLQGETILISGATDCVLDLLPPSAPAKPIRAALMTVRQSGRIILMGGVGMLGGTDWNCPTPGS